jgi:hypothetical protein
MSISMAKMPFKTHKVYPKLWKYVIGANSVWRLGLFFKNMHIIVNVNRTLTTENNLSKLIITQVFSFRQVTE